MTNRTYISDILFIILSNLSLRQRLAALRSPSRNGSGKPPTVIKRANTSAWASCQDTHQIQRDEAVMITTNKGVPASSVDINSCRTSYQELYRPLIGIINSFNPVFPMLILMEFIKNNKPIVRVPLAD